MQTDRTDIPAFAPGTRVYAKYQGGGTVIIPNADVLEMPHFDDDVPVRWDNGAILWHGPTVLRRT
jgi:hypothetical protein